jgi:glycosyltransferase involved in cell wall biosynthesis
VLDGKKIAVVVPAYREEALIAQTIRGIPDFVDQVIVVDDCSPDRTFEAASSAATERVSIIRLEENQGVGGAIIAGHKLAMQNGADIMVVMAGDDQMDPYELPRLLEPILKNGYGFAKGNRFYPAAETANMPRHRLFGNIVLTLMQKSSSGYWHIVDPQNGYTAVTRESLESIPLDQVSRRYEFENDLLIWLNIANVRAKDVNIPARYGSEISTIKLHTAVPRIVWLMFRGFWRRLWLKHFLWSFSPIGIMFALGLFFVLIGFAVGLWASYYALGGSSPTAGTTVLAVVPFMSGFYLLVQALVLDIQASPD